MSNSKSNPRKPSRPEPTGFQSIDPTSLATVSGGASRVATASQGGDTSVTDALNGILDSLKSLQGQQQSGFGPTEMMMFMMLMAGRQQPQVVSTIPNGVTIDGRWYPFK
ncbi:MAG TPA: hypothetical protein VFQ53_07965 [Kofleriaceae bacterium]|nr:hypothetical protein [Kofleriaceae bacterium]